MVVLEISVVNQTNDPVLHFWRCPMIPCKDPNAETGHDDDLSEQTLELSKETIIDAARFGISPTFETWQITRFPPKRLANVLSLRREIP